MDSQKLLQQISNNTPKPGKTLNPTLLHAFRPDVRKFWPICGAKSSDYIIHTAQFHRFPPLDVTTPFFFRAQQKTKKNKNKNKKKILQHSVALMDRMINLSIGGRGDVLVGLEEVRHGIRGRGYLRDYLTCTWVSPHCHSSGYFLAPIGVVNLCKIPYWNQKNKLNIAKIFCFLQA